MPLHVKHSVHIIVPRGDIRAALHRVAYDKDGPEGELVGAGGYGELHRAGFFKERRRIPVNIDGHGEGYGGPPLLKAERARGLGLTGLLSALPRSAGALRRLFFRSIPGAYRAGRRPKLFPKALHGIIKAAGDTGGALSVGIYPQLSSAEVTGEFPRYSSFVKIKSPAPKAAAASARDKRLFPVKLYHRPVVKSTASAAPVGRGIKKDREKISRSQARLILPCC